MKTLLTANLSTKTASLGTSAWSPPIFAFGESMTLALRFAALVEGNTVEPALDIRGLTAAIGNVDERPTSGEFSLQIGPGAQTSDNTTAPLHYDCAPATLAAAINAKPAVVTAYGTAKAEKVDGSWLIVFGEGAAEVPLQVRRNRLLPVCLGRITAGTVDGRWTHELRFAQVPVAFTDSSARVLPPPPTITRVRAGGTEDGYAWNEIQALYVPPDFRATYCLKRGYGRTEKLSVEDSADTIQAALVAALGANFSVTNPSPYTAHIEFVGDLAGAAADLLEVIALDPPPGDLTFTLDLDRAPLLALLRSQPEVTLPLEVRIQTADSDDAVTEQVAFRQRVTIRRPVIYPELAETPSTDWLRPPSPRSYVPHSAGTVITGHQFARSVVGDGSATAFTIAHGLDTEDVFVCVRENASGGRQLVDGTDFAVVLDDANSATVTALGAPPALNAWSVTVVSAQTVAAFADGLTVTIGQVTGLEDRFAALEATVAEVLDLVPTTPLGTAAAASADTITIDLGTREEMFPGRMSTAGAWRPGGLLPAIHDAEPASITGALPDLAASAGIVFSNDTEGVLLLPGGLGMRGTALAAGGFAGCDGRRFYPVRRSGESNSYFPTDFERELWMVEVNAAMLRAATTLTVSMRLDLRLEGATSRAQYVLVIEHGTAPSQTTPSPTAANLQEIAWAATPLLRQRLILSGAKVSHKVGVQVVRAANGVLSANKVLYGYTTAADDTPASADLALRARLIEFDTENTVADAKGSVSLSLSDAVAFIK